MLTRASKEGVKALLAERKFDQLAELILLKRSNMRYLNRLLYDPDTLVRWRAIEGIGFVGDRLAGEDPEAVRVIIRNLMWTVNEESGGIGWSAPESIGEIIYHRPEMYEEFASIVLSFMEERMLLRGAVWAAGRIAQARPELVREYVPDITALLDDSDPVVRGYALRFLDIVGESPTLDRFRYLLDDQNSVPVYENGRLKEITVAGLAAQLLNRH